MTHHSSFLGRESQIAILESQALRHRSAQFRQQHLRAFTSFFRTIHELQFSASKARLMDERSAINEPLAKSEIRQHHVINSWAQAVWETNAHGVVTSDSPSWRDFTGQTLEEWLGYGWLGAIHPDDQAYAERQWREAIAVHGIVNAEFRLRAPDGGWRWTNVRAIPIFDKKGEITKWAGMNFDIDVRKRVEANELPQLP